MSPHGRAEPALIVLLLAALTACGGETPTTPTPTPTSHPNVSITSMSVTGEAGASGVVYRVVVHLKESAGVAATIATVDLTFMSGAAAFVTSHHEQPISASSNVCPASGTIDTRELTTSDADASHSHATSVQAKVAYTDGSVNATATASADVPPFGGPAPPTYTLTGLIGDFDTRVGIDGARLEILNGVNAGRFASTDRSGMYALDGLQADTFRLRASRDGYNWGEQNVTVPAIPRADFLLQRTAPTPPARVEAVYDGAFKAPVCGSIGSACDSGTLLDGSGSTEANQPNTIGSSCPDGAGSGHYGMIATISVSTVDGSALAENKTVRIEVDGGRSTADRLRLYVAADARQPVWILIAERAVTGGVFTTVLPKGGAMQAVRGTMSFGSSFGPGPCATGSDDDNDDLVFRVR